MNSKILVVEDNDDDTQLIQLAFQRYPLCVGPIRFEPNGRRALEYLHARLSGGSLPLVVVSDLKMPALDGFGLLRAIRQNPELRRLPFVMFTASNLDADRLRAIELGADLYLVKPSRFAEMAEVASQVDRVIRELAGARMRLSVLVQSLETTRFFAGTVCWTELWPRALNFETVQRALWFCSKAQLRNVRILVGASTESECRFSFMFPGLL